MIFNWNPGFIVALEEQVDSSVPEKEEEGVKKQHKIFTGPIHITQKQREWKIGSISKKTNGKKSSDKTLYYSIINNSDAYPRQ